VLEKGGVKVPKPEVLTLIAQFDGGVDKSTLAELRQQMERQPLPALIAPDTRPSAGPLFPPRSYPSV